MAVVITHNFVSTELDSGETEKVGPNEWNDDHVVSGLGDAAEKNTGTTAGTVAAGNDSRITGAAQKSANLSDLENVATAFGNIKQAASDTDTGVVELATTSEATTGTDTQRAVTPAGLKAHVDAAIAAVRNGVSSAFDTLAEIATELALKATIASPALTGTPTAPTAAQDTNTTQIATTAFVNTEIAADAEKLGVSRGNREETDSFTFVLSDAGKTVFGNKATAMSATVPPNSSVAFEVNTYLNIAQKGAGVLTIVAGSGVTIRNRNGLILGGQYGGASLLKVGTNEWYAFGDLKAS